MSDDLPVSLYLTRDVDLEGATIIDGFPSVGLVSTITGNFLVDALDLEHVGSLDSPHFPTVSIVRDGVPYFPVRVYAGEGLCVFISEFQPSPETVRPLAQTVTRFALDRGAQRVVSPEGLVRQDEDDDGVPEEDEKVQVYGLGSTTEARDDLSSAGVPSFEDGLVTGVSGVLLNLGKKHGFEAVTVLAEANPNYPDARAAGKVIEAIADIIPGLEIDVGPLYSQAENIEGTLRRMQQQAQQGGGGDRDEDIPPMYG
jgi:uncharacterized protein